MSAIATAFVIGLVAVGLVLGIVVFAAVALLGLKALITAHEGRSWVVNRSARRRA